LYPLNLLLPILIVPTLLTIIITKQARAHKYTVKRHKNDYWRGGAHHSSTEKPSPAYKIGRRPPFTRSVRRGNLHFQFSTHARTHTGASRSQSYSPSSLPLPFLPSPALPLPPHPRSSLEKHPQPYVFRRPTRTASRCCCFGRRHRRRRRGTGASGRKSIRRAPAAWGWGCATCRSGGPPRPRRRQPRATPPARRQAPPAGEASR
jgi:hypothetical protein